MTDSANTEDLGHCSSDEQLQRLYAKSESLGRIGRALSRWKKNGLSPNRVHIVAATCVIFAFVIGLVIAAYCYEIEVNIFAAFGGSIGASALVSLYLQENGSAPRSHTEHLDQLLADYEPFQKDEYRKLQEQVTAGGTLEVGLVQEWFDAENKAIQTAIDRLLLSKGQFIKKKV